MALSIGIVGLPNVGKSTIHNALTRAQNAEAANYPFCTIEPNKAVVPVPDTRIDALAAIVEPRRTVNATVEFLDIAGLVKGASRGEGLGNQFLGNIRECAALLHVVRCFEDPDVVHVDGAVDPVRDAEVIELELILADDQTLAKRIDALERRCKQEKALRPVFDAAQGLQAHLQSGLPVASFPEHEKDPVRQLLQDLPLLTDKKVIYCANVDEAGMREGNAHVEAIERYAGARGCEAIRICAKMEEELGALEDEERREYLEAYGVRESGLEKVIRTGYAALGLISYFTAGPKEVRAWTIRNGWKAPQAAGVIHTDFAKGFVRAEVIPFAAYVEHGGEAGAKAAGVMRVEGKDYVVQDGDVMNFRFNV